MQTIHPATAERMSSSIQRDAAQLPPQFCAMPRLMTQRDLATYLSSLQLGASAPAGQATAPAL